MLTFEKASVPAKAASIVYKSPLQLTTRKKDVEHLPVKRKSRGRSKGSKGKSSLVQCSSCGELVPRDKAKRVSRRVSVVDYALAKELRQKGTYIAAPVKTMHYCVSCAVHHGVVKVRSKKERRQRGQKRY